MYSLFNLPTRTRKRVSNLAAAAICAGSLGTASAQTTNWVAYNDHAPGPLTHANATGYNMRGVAATTAAGSVLTGNLKDFTTANSVPVILTSTAVGTPDDFGSSAAPNAGTDAYNLFNGILDLGNNNSMIGVRASTGSKSIVTLSGLDPNKRYVFKGTAVRGNSYTRRWTLVTLSGADSYAEDHSAVGIFTAVNYPAGGMTAEQAAFNSGENRANGSVVGWKEINPGADGTIVLTSEQFAPATLPNGETPDTGNYGYGLNSMMLAEVETGPVVAPTITVQPINVTTNEGSVARLSVGASGSGNLSYQWFRNGAAIAGPAGTSSSLVVTNMSGTSTKTWSVPSDSGTYHVVVTGAVAPPATSGNAQVTIAPDTIAPRFLWAVATNNPLGGVGILVRLSEPVQFVDTEQLAWYVFGDAGPGADFEIPETVLVSGTDITLNYPSAAIDAGTTYRLEFQAAAMQDTAETPNTMTANSVPVLAHESEKVPLNQIWKFSDFDVAAPTGWMDRTFDDSDLDFWKEGPGVFDGKRGAEGVPWCRDTALHNLGPVGTCITLSNANAAGAVATYYFRTHFVFNGDPAAALLQMNGKFDDGAIVYLNGTEIWRVGLPLGTFAHAGYVAGIRTVGDGDAQDMTLTSSSALRAGDNVLAVELRQINATSSDVTMGLRLVTLSASPSAPSGATMVVSRNPTTGEVTITWGGGGALERSTAVGPAASWQPVAGATSPHTFTPAAGTQGFYRVSQ